MVPIVRVSSANIYIYIADLYARETSNKALNAINAIRLAPFLMSFLAFREQLPIAPVVAAGTLAPFIRLSKMFCTYGCYQPSAYTF